MRGLSSLFSVLTLLLSFTSLNAQNYFDYKGVKENYITERNPFKREAWFYERRMNHAGFPEDVFAKGIQERNHLRNSQGFFLNSRNTWTSIGPTPGSFALSGPISSRITTVKYHPANPNIIYLGAANGGVWKSTDGGVNWLPKTDNEVSMSSGSICIDPANPEIIYYGTGEATYSGASYFGRGLLKSTNGGETWTNYTQGLPLNSYCSRIVVRPGHSNELLIAGGQAGLYRSTTSGESWTQIITGRCDDVIFSPTGDTCHIIGTGTGYRISVNGGVTFTPTPTSFTIGTRSHIGLCKSSPNIIYATTLTGSTVTVYKSINAGTNFSQVGAAFNFAGNISWYCYYLHVSPFDPDYAVVGTFNVQRTTNGGTDWERFPSDNLHPDHHNMDFNPVNPNEFIISNDGGVWKTTNKGNNWINLNTTLNLTQFYRVTSAPNNVNHLLGGTQDNGTQRTTGSLAWSAVISGDGGDVAFNSQNPNIILGEAQENYVFRSTNGGVNFTNAVTGLTGTAPWVGALTAHPDSGNIFYTGRLKIFKTTNSALTWDSLSKPAGADWVIEVIEISRSNPAVMYCASDEHVFKSTNRGYNWVNISNNITPYNITAIDIHPDSSNVIVISTGSPSSQKILKSTNSGGNWMNITGNLPLTYTNDVMFYHPGFSTNSIIAALDVGVFITNNYGANWMELGSGLPNTVAMDLDYNRAANRLRIGTHGRGVWEINGTISGVTGFTNNLPDKFLLSQNYPNPFNPVTKINYALSKNSMVSLKVFDLMGREVSELVNKYQQQGTYETVFDGTKLSSGIYFYVLNAEGFQQTKKMILVK